MEPPPYCVKDVDLLDSLTCIVWVARPDGTLSYLNKAWRDFTGLSADVPGKWFWLPAVHPACQGFVRKAWEKSLREGSPYSTRYRVRRHDGEYRWFEAHGEKVHTKDVTYWAGTLVDVQATMDEERRAWNSRNQATRQEILLQGIVNIIPHAVAVVLPPHGRILWTNPALFEIWRIDTKPPAIGEEEASRDESMSLANYGFRAFHDDGTPFQRDDWPETAALHGITRRLNYVPVIRLDDTRCMFSMSAFPIRDQQDHVLAVVTIFDDVTARNREQDRAVAERVQHERVEMRSTFLANVSHELKTPLTASMASASLLADTASDFTPEQKESLASVREGCRLALQRMDDLLDITRLELGEVSLTEATFTIRELLEATVEKFQGSHASVDMTVAQDVPETLIGDGPKVSRLLSVILDNAVKFSKDTDAVVKVTCRKAVPRHDEQNNTPGVGVSLVLEISDNGIGIPTGLIPKLFAPFVQRDLSRVRTHGGTGIGLSIARRLCDIMGGTIHVSSVPEQGTTVYIELPFIIGQEMIQRPIIGPMNAQVNIRQPLPVPQRKNSEGRGTKAILIAEDNPLSARVLAKTLRMYGYTNVDTAADGLIALDKFRRGKYDLVLMDCQMPGLDGYQCTERIREFDTVTPILALSADSSAMDGKWGIAGMNAYLEKPFLPEKLAKALDEHLFT